MPHAGQSDFGLNGYASSVNSSTTSLRMDKDASLGPSFHGIAAVLAKARDHIFERNPVLDSSVAELECVANLAEIPAVRHIAPGTVSFHKYGESGRQTGSVHHGPGFAIGRHSLVVMLDDEDEGKWMTIDTTASSPETGVGPTITPAEAAGRGLEQMNTVSREFSSLLNQCGVYHDFVSLDLGDLLKTIPPSALNDLAGPDGSLRQMIEDSIFYRDYERQTSTDAVISRLEGILEAGKSMSNATSTIQY